MPHVLSVREVSLEFSDLYRRTPIPASTPDSRDPSVHQSDILSFIARKIGKMKPGERLEEEMPWRMAMGNMWEEFYFSLIPDSVYKPGETVVDGVAVNADGIGMVGIDERTGRVYPNGHHPAPADMDYCVLESVVEETKCTEKKPKTAEEFIGDDNQWVWNHQGRGYCYCYGPRIVRWTVLHYRGDWKGSGPIVMEYVVRFSDEEVKETWRMEGKYKVEVERSLGMKEGEEVGEG